MISVVMSVFNGAGYLIESVQSVLDQSYANFEFIIVDDCSTDGSLEILETYRDARIRIIRNQENLGLTKSLNVAMSEAKGKYLARQDADDISLPDRFKTQFDYLESFPEVALVGGQPLLINEKGQALKGTVLAARPTKPWAIRWFCQYENPFVHSSVMMRKEIIVEKFKGYNEHFRTNQDYELWSRLAFGYPCVNLNTPVVKLRKHTASISANYSSKGLSNKLEVSRNAQMTACQLEQDKEWFEWLFLAHTSNPKEVSRRSPEVIDQMYRAFMEHNTLDEKSRKAVKKERDKFAAHIAYFLATSNKLTSFRLVLGPMFRNFRTLSPMLLRYIVLFFTPIGFLKIIKKRKG